MVKQYMNVFHKSTNNETFYGSVPLTNWKGYVSSNYVIQCDCEKHQKKLHGGYEVPIETTWRVTSPNRNDMAE